MNADLRRIANETRELTEQLRNGLMDRSRSDKVERPAAHPRPPSTVKISPVINPAFGRTLKATASAVSTGWAERSSGMPMGGSLRPPQACSTAVSPHPPIRPRPERRRSPEPRALAHSAASVCVIDITPAFAAAGCYRAGTPGPDVIRQDRHDRTPGLGRIMCRPTAREQ